MNTSATHLRSGKILLCCFTLLYTFSFVLLVRLVPVWFCGICCVPLMVGWAVSYQVFHWLIFLFFGDFFWPWETGAWQRICKSWNKEKKRPERFFLPYVFPFICLATKQCLLDRLLCSDLGIHVMSPQCHHAIVSKCKISYYRKFDTISITITAVNCKKKYVSYQWKQKSQNWIPF